MAGVNGNCCERKFLYEVETPGLLYISLDGHDRVFVGFQHSLKLEVSLVHPGGEDKTALTSGKLDMVYPRSSTTQDKDELSGSKHFTEQRMSSDCPPMAMEDPVLPLGSSPQGNEDSDYVESLLPTSPTPTDDVADISKQQTTIFSSQSGAPLPAASVQLNTEPTGKKTVNQKSKKVLQGMAGKANPKSVGKVKNTFEDLKVVREKATAKLLMLKARREKDSMVLSRDQLEIFLKGSKKSRLDGEDIPGSSTVTKPSNDATGKPTEQEVKQESSSSTDHLDTPVTCKYCAQTFPSQKDYHKHRKTAVLNYHVCLKCNVAFPFRAYLLAHMKYHNDKGQRSSYECDRCEFRTSSFSELKKHMICHTGEQCFRCCQCRRKFSTYATLLKHMSTHRPKGLFKCSCCNEYFPSRGALSEHKMAHQQLTCGLCGQVFPNRTSRLIHYKTDHKDTILKCTQPGCDKMYSHKDELESHLKMHKQRRRRQCPICGAMVVRLVSHLRSHKSIDEMPDSELFMCDQCPMKFKTNTLLKEHMRRHGNEKIKCHLCPKSFPTRAGLSRHLINVHSSLMRHQCEICGKQCKQKANLRVHMRIHSDTKMFPCNFCDQAFNYKASLQGHIRSKHSMASTAGSEVPSTVQNSASSSALGGGGKLCDRDPRTEGTTAIVSPGSSPQVVASYMPHAESSFSWNESDVTTQGNNQLVWSVERPGVSYQWPA
ncbi:zinc finger protein 2 homolog [Elysia marginata]|uniref:Zinc finger protein 2 homolog n=1 Tax=Elysia marginata TaxID=1093978 RepID=A0AAV4ECN1_9GAST|nr:zinc finger protein 2 homolog [Elysia marginata]